MGGRSTIEPMYFPTPAAFGAWLKRHHATATELLVGYWKTGTGKPSMSWPDSVDEALCYGWIDGVRKRIDDERYQIRFTPRKPGSIWSKVNIAKVQALIASKRMHPAGLRAFEVRTAERSEVYAYERAAGVLDPADIKRFKAQPAAWAYFQAQAPWYKRVCVHWVTTAKKPETRARRLEQLIAACARSERLRR